MPRMVLLRLLSALCASALAFLFSPQASGPASTGPRAYLGFDRNQYPGDEAMKALRRDFVFSGYWLGPPPGETANTWQGKREYLRSLGYGFLLLVDARDSRELKAVREAAAKGTTDARAAADAARKEGFAAGAVIFSDVEEGGRLDANYHAYLKAWSDELRRAGFGPGVYCSGMPVSEGHGVTITTAEDLHSDASLGELTFWVYNDACPPSKGCTVALQPPSPVRSGIGYAVVWQFAQSPRRRQYTARCKVKYAADGNCYAPSDAAHKWFLDLNSATSPDPSGGAK